MNKTVIIILLTIVVLCFLQQLAICTPEGWLYFYIYVVVHLMSRVNRKEHNTTTINTVVTLNERQ